MKKERLDGDAGVPATLRRIADELERSLPALSVGAAAQPAGPPVALARFILRLRRRRDTIFETALFADPAWDILLDIYSETARGRQVTISAACIGAAVPATTALRWIGTLEREHLLARQPDARDGRRIYLELTPLAREKLEAVLAIGGADPAFGVSLAQMLNDQR
jgi:DNA-binding MarR family transcriptional regulator